MGCTCVCCSHLDLSRNLLSGTLAEGLFRKAANLKYEMILLLLYAGVAGAVLEEVPVIVRIQDRLLFGFSISSGGQKKEHEYEIVEQRNGSRNGNSKAAGPAVVTVPTLWLSCTQC